MYILHLKIADMGGEMLQEFPISRVFNLGFTMKDRNKMQAHLDECGKEGIKVPYRDHIPHIMPISSWATLTDNEITVQYEKTSGEVEIVTLAKGNEVYVGVGSDHSDRALEVTDIPRSKQVVPNVLAPIIWRWSDVASHWDKVMIECKIVEDGKESIYQKAFVSEFWSPIEMLDSVRELVSIKTDGYLVLFSGTVVSIGNKLNYARDWIISMIDPVLNRRIEHTYHIVVLNEEIPFAWR